MKYAIKHEVGSVYWLEGESLAYAPINKDGTFDTDFGGIVEEELMDNERIPRTDILFSELYVEVRELLKK